MPTTSLTQFISSKQTWADEGSLVVHGAPEGADALAIAMAARGTSQERALVIYIARDASRAAAMASAVGFFASDVPVMNFPAWDCLPYDRVSPSAEVTAQRMAVLTALATRDLSTPLILITTVNAVAQRTPPVALVETTCFQAKPGHVIGTEALLEYLNMNGYSRASTVLEAGDYAVRGGLIDLFPPGAVEPLRLDFFGDTLETIRAFDAATQRTTAQRDQINLTAACEVLLTDETVTRFRQSFRTAFGAAGDNPLYEAISAGRKHAGMEAFPAIVL